MRAFLLLLALGAVCASVFAAAKSVAGSKSAPIRGNAPQMIYHLPECPSYWSIIMREDQGDREFGSEKEALEAGFRKALNCP